MASNAKQIIGNAVRAAQDLEEKKQEREAYQYYLYAVQQITAQLQHATPQGSTSDCGVPPTKLFTLASSCLESAQRLLNQASQENRDFTSAQIQSMPATTTNTAAGSAIGTHKSPSFAHQHKRTMTFGSGCTGVTHNNSPSLRHHSYSSFGETSKNNAPLKRKPQVQRRQLQHQQQLKQQYDVQPLHRISPMDEARRKNMHLMQQYKANLRKDSMKILGTSRQNLTLNYLRRMEENKSVAKITEQNLARKAKEREARLKQENQRVKMTTFRKSMDSLSNDDLMQEVASFEQGKPNFQAAKQKLSGSPDSTNLVCDLIHEVLSCFDHPLCKLMGECQYSITQFLQPLTRKIENIGRLPFCTITRDPSGRHLTTVISVSSDSDNSVEKSSPIDTSRQHPSPTVVGSLDRKLATLKAELVDSDEENEDTVLQRSKSDCITNNCSPVNDDDFEEQLFSMSSPNAGSSDLQPNNNDDVDDETFSDDDFTTLRELNNDEPEPTMNTQNHQTQQDTVVTFRGLVHVTCQPQYGIESSFTKLSKECSDYLTGAVKLVRSGVDKMVSSFAASYPEITIEDNNDECRNVIEDNFFPVITPLLLPIYRASNYSAECDILKNIVEHSNDTPKEVGVRRKFWLEDQDMAPYSNAINILQELCRLQTPRAKLGHLVKFSKSIIQSIEDYYAAASSTDTKVDTGVGVDDILPIMTYAIIKSACPELISECSYMQDFIQECYSMGEEGFCLTSFDTAVKFVTQMNS